MLVRAAQAADADAVARIQQETWRVAYAHVFPEPGLAQDFIDAERWRRRLADPPPGWSTFVTGDPVVGFASVGPSRDEPKWRWITWGSTFAALAWLGFSAIFSFYAAHFGSFNKAYGSLGAIIGFMTWMWLSVAVILLGAKLNAETEHQTARDSTEGSPKPLGARGAKMADTVGPSRS